MRIHNSENQTLSLRGIDHSPPAAALLATRLQACSPTTLTITPDPASVSPLPKKTADYVDSVCVAIYGIDEMMLVVRMAHRPNELKN